MGSVIGPLPSKGAAPLLFETVYGGTAMNDDVESILITIDDAFEAVRVFIESYWERGGNSSDDIAILLGSLNRNREIDVTPLDPAQWQDWLNAVAIATKTH